MCKVNQDKEMINAEGALSDDDLSQVNGGTAMTIGTAAQRLKGTTKTSTHSTSTLGTTWVTAAPGLPPIDSTLLP